MIVLDELRDDVPEVPLTNWNDAIPKHSSLIELTKRSTLRLLGVNAQISQVVNPHLQSIPVTTIERPMHTAPHVVQTIGRRYHVAQVDGGP